MSVPGSFGREGGIAAVNAATVHQLEMDILIVRLHPEVILEHLAAGGAAAWILPVERHLLSADEAAVLIASVGNEAIVRIHGHWGGRAA